MGTRADPRRRSRRPRRPRSPAPPVHRGRRARTRGRPRRPARARPLADRVGDPFGDPVPGRRQPSARHQARASLGQRFRLAIASIGDGSTPRASARYVETRSPNCTSVSSRASSTDRGSTPREPSHRTRARSPPTAGSGRRRRRPHRGAGARSGRSRLPCPPTIPRPRCDRARATPTANEGTLAFSLSCDFQRIAATRADAVGAPHDGNALPDRERERLGRVRRRWDVGPRLGDHPASSPRRPRRRRPRATACIPIDFERADRTRSTAAERGARHVAAGDVTRPMLELLARRASSPPDVRAIIRQPRPTASSNSPSVSTRVARVRRGDHQGVRSAELGEARASARPRSGTADAEPRARRPRRPRRRATHPAEGDGGDPVGVGQRARVPARARSPSRHRGRQPGDDVEHPARIGGAKRRAVVEIDHRPFFLAALPRDRPRLLRLVDQHHRDAVADGIPVAARRDRRGPRDRPAGSRARPDRSGTPRSRAARRRASRRVLLRRRISSRTSAGLAPSGAPRSWPPRSAAAVAPCCSAAR